MKNRKKEWCKLSLYAPAKPGDNHYSLIGEVVLQAVVIDALTEGERLSRFGDVSIGKNYDILCSSMMTYNQADKFKHTGKETPWIHRYE